MMAIFAASIPAAAATREPDPPTLGRPGGRPRVRLNRLSFAPSAADARSYEPQLRRVLQREARRADWGAGRGSTIHFRFTVEELRFERQGQLLKVHCSAVGELPGRRTARSRLAFGGRAEEAPKLVARVLEIVARGVMTRLSDLERTRRSR